MPIGGQGSLGLVKETSFGAGGSLSKYQTITSESLNLTEANVYADRIQATAEQVGANIGNESVAGDVVFPVTPKMPSEWFQCALGQSTSPFYWQRPMNSLMIAVDHSTSAIQASGCMVDSLVLASTQGGELGATATIQGKGLSKTSALSPTYTSGDNPYLHSDASFQLNGVVDTSITTWSVTIANNLVADLFGTGRQRLDIPGGKLIVTGTYTKLFDDVLERDAFLNVKTRSFWVKFARAGNYLTVYCPTIKYNTHTENITAQSDYILETFNWTAYTEDPANVQSVRISGDFS